MLPNESKPCQGCGYTWTSKELKHTGIAHFGGPYHSREVLEPSGSVWVVSFDLKGEVAVIDQCSQCPLLVSFATMNVETC